MSNATPQAVRDAGGNRPRGLAVGLALLLFVFAAAARGADAPPDVDGIFITVQNPITTDVTHRVREATDRKVQKVRESANGRRVSLKIVYDFNPDNKPAGTRDFGPCHDLAKYLLGLRDVSTVAFVHGEVTRHTVLPVLACKEIVMAGDARLGDVTRDQDVNVPLANSEIQAYKDVALGQNRYPAVVLKMLDKDTEVLQGNTRKGSVWYYDSRQKKEEVEKEAQDAILQTQPQPVLPRGAVKLYTAAEAEKYRLCQLIRESRQEVAEAYQMPASSLREDPLMGRTPVVWAVEIRGQVTNALRESIERRIRDAIGNSKSPANIIILELRCGGGETQAAAELAEFLRTLKDNEGVNPVRTVAYIPEKAPDTATYLAFGCSEIVMNKKAELGDFSAFVVEQRNGRGADVDPRDNNMRMKALMDLAAAQGYSPLIARGMMDRHVTIYSVRSRFGNEWKLISGEELEADKKEAERTKTDPKWRQERLIKRDGDLLVVKGEDNEKDDARKLGVAREVVDDTNSAYGLYIEPSKVHVARGDWLDAVATFLRNPLMAVFLVMLGITCLILELKMPGVGLPGIIAALCFVLFFWAHSQFAGEITMLAVLLFALGLILIGLEVFVLPGFGVAGVSGLILVFGSLGLVAYGHWPRTSGEWFGFARTLGPFGLSLVGAVIAAFILARYLPSIPYANRLIMKPVGDGKDLLLDDTATAGASTSTTLLGAIGVAATPLRPAGKVKFGDEYVDVLAEGSYIPPGGRVQVIEIEGNRVVVKEVV
jgi:membrane-bound serine protease (ClpP class)